MKASGIDRLPEIPAQWQRSRLCFEASVKARLGWKGLKAEEYLDDGFVLLSTPNIKDREIDFEHVNYISKERYVESPEIMLEEGDVLLTKDGFTLGTANVVRALPRPATLNGSIALVRPHESLDSIFLYYFFVSDFFQYLVHLMKDGMDILHLFQADLRHFDLLVPPLVEQRRIASFLDRKTAAIDALIAKKERLIELLQEKRQALITQAVTKGLDPSVPMKESGDPWIGGIPANWRWTRLGFLSSIGNGSTPSREEPGYWSDDGFPWLNSAKVNEETVPAPDRFVTPRALRECHLPLVRPGTLLMAITGEGQTRGRAALLAFNATISQHIAAIAPTTNITPRFLLRQLQARYWWLRSESSGGGSTKGALTCEFLRTVPIALPPRDDQEFIADFLDRSLSDSDRLVGLTVRSVDLLREYRQSLITAAVTGKLEIPPEE